MDSSLAFNGERNNDKSTGPQKHYNLKIAFLILAHKNPSQIVSFIETLDCEQTTFFIHIDKKSNIINDNSLEKIKNKKNVYFTKKREKVSWGGYGDVAATLHLLNECLEKDAFDYVSLHSGQDLPIKNKYEIRDYLKKNQGIEFINYHKIPLKGWLPDNGLERIRYFWFVEEYGLDKSFVLYEDQKRLNIEREFFNDLQPYGGSQWWTITRECAQYITEYVNRNPKYCDYFRYTLLPDEVFFQTIILNSHFKDRIINDNLTYIDWNSGPQYPRSLTSQDFQKLIKSDKLFARKFDVEGDNTIIQKIVDRVM